MRSSSSPRCITLKYKSWRTPIATSTWALPSMMATSGELCAPFRLALFVGKMAQSDGWRNISITLKIPVLGLLSSPLRFPLYCQMVGHLTNSDYFIHASLRFSPTLSPRCRGFLLTVSYCAGGHRVFRKKPNGGRSRWALGVSRFELLEVTKAYTPRLCGKPSGVLISTNPSRRIG